MVSLHRLSLKQYLVRMRGRCSDVSNWVSNREIAHATTNRRHATGLFVFLTEGKTDWKKVVIGDRCFHRYPMFVHARMKAHTCNITGGSFAAIDFLGLV